MTDCVTQFGIRYGLRNNELFFDYEKNGSFYNS